MQKKWFIGCSGFHYKEWKEFFYPAGLPATRWFEYYSKYFNTLELNVTFYRFPQLKTLEGWYAKAPDDFVFSAKVPRLITHYKQFRDTFSLTNEFYDTLRSGLREKLACVLFQLPPQLAFSDDALERILSNMDPSFVNVVEFRHKTWWQQKVYDLLGARNISFCGHSYPNLPDDVIINAPVNYYRFHGVPKLYYSQYPDEFVKRIGETIQSSEVVERAYVYFNNTATQAALNNARFLKSMVD